MSMLEKYGIIKESSLTDDINTAFDDTDTDEKVSQDLDDTIDDFDNFEEIDPEEIEYTEEMVVVFGKETEGKPKYYIEHESLARYMQDKKLGLKEAMQKVCESNNIPFENSLLLVESKEDYIQSIKEAKAALKSKSLKGTTKNNLKQKCKTTSDAFDTAENLNIKIAKKGKKKK